jgi:hypothetical protein
MHSQKWMLVCMQYGLTAGALGPSTISLDMSNNMSNKAPPPPWPPPPPPPRPSPPPQEWTLVCMQYGFGYWGIRNNEHVFLQKNATFTRQVRAHTHTYTLLSRAS